MENEEEVVPVNFSDAEKVTEHLKPQVFKSHQSEFSVEKCVVSGAHIQRDIGTPCRAAVDAECADRHAR